MREAARVVGLYHDGAPGRLLPRGRRRRLGHVPRRRLRAHEHRGRGLGVELVREMVEHGPYARCKWLLHTADAHELYAKFGFGEPGRRTYEPGH